MLPSCRDVCAVIEGLCPTPNLPKTCPGPHQGDPIHNFLDYSHPACQNQLTPQQVGGPQVPYWGCNFWAVVSFLYYSDLLESADPTPGALDILASLRYLGYLCQGLRV